MAISVKLNENQLRKAASELSEETAVEELASNPQEFMARFGVKIDKETATAIRNRLAGEKYAETAAGIVHIDIPT